METLALMAGIGLPHAAVRDQVATAIDLVVHQRRDADGGRRVASVARVVRAAGGAATRELYALRDGRPVWRAGHDDLAARLAAGAGAAPGASPTEPEGAAGPGAATPPRRS